MIVVYLLLANILVQCAVIGIMLHLSSQRQQARPERAQPKPQNPVPAPTFPAGSIFDKLSRATTSDTIEAFRTLAVEKVKEQRNGKSYT